MKGWVDLQVNGYAGVDFGAPGLSLAAVEQAAAALRRRGTVAFCPTVVTTDLAVYRRVLPVLAEACASVPGLLGIHLEGPFISPEPGAVGAHPVAAVRAPSCACFDELAGLCGGHLRLLTLAPERPGAPDLIAAAVAAGVRVAIGHSLADEAAVAEAVAAGATLSTHLGNGLPAWVDRHRNPLWPQLAEPRLTALLITDGHHVPPAFIRTVLAVKGPDRVIVTSDSAPLAGLPPGAYELYGSPVELSREGCIRRPDGYLAGSSSCLAECLDYLAGMGIDAEVRARLGRENALRALGKSEV